MFGADMRNKRVNQTRDEIVNDEEEENDQLHVVMNYTRRGVVECKKE